MKNVQPNYVRTYRKISALTQGDLSALLDQNCTATISRIELSKNIPTFHTAIALAIILDVPLETLFAGILHDVGVTIKKRAQQRVQSLDGIKLTTRNFKRKQSLFKLIERNLVDAKNTYEKQQIFSK